MAPDNVRHADVLEGRREQMGRIFCLICCRYSTLGSSSSVPGGPKGPNPPLGMPKTHSFPLKSEQLRVNPDSPPDMVGGCSVCFQGVSGCRPGVTHDMIGHRTGSRVPSLRVSAAVRCQLWLFSGRRRHGPAWQLGRVAYKPMLQAGSPYARYGSAASANILCRALSSNSYEGWPRARRMINLLA